MTRHLPWIKLGRDAVLLGATWLLTLTDRDRAVLVELLVRADPDTGELPDANTAANLLLHRPRRSAEAAIQRLLEVGVLETLPGGQLGFCTWDDLTFRTTDPTRPERQARYRQRRRDASRTTAATRGDGDVDSDPDVDQGGERGATADAAPPSGGGPPAPCPHGEVVQLYHECLPENPRVADWPEHRRRLLAASWGAAPERQDLAWWRSLFERVARSPFLTGKAAGTRGRDSFKADLEWILVPANLLRIREGRYDGDADSVGALTDEMRYLISTREDCHGR